MRSGCRKCASPRPCDWTRRSTRPRACEMRQTSSSSVRCWIRRDTSRASCCTRSHTRARTRITAASLSWPPSMTWPRWARCRRLARRLSARYRAHDQVWLAPGGDLRGQRIVGRIFRAILLARVEPEQRPPLLGGRITDGSLQHRVLRFERIEHRALSDLSIDAQFHLFAHARERAEIGGQHDPYHCRV